MGKQHKWTAEENEFLIEAVKQHSSWNELYADMQIIFNVDFSENALKCHCIQKGWKLGLPNKYSPYSQAEKEYVLENIGKKTLQEIANGLERLSGRKSTKSAVGHYVADTLGLNPSGVHGNLSAWELPYNTKEAGVERTNSFDGYTYIKGNGIREWKAKHQVEWEKANGRLPDGCMVIFLNRDKTDFSPENLYCVSRKVHAVMCSNGWYSEHPELTLAAIKWCELHYAIKEVGARG